MSKNSLGVIKEKKRNLGEEMSKENEIFKAISNYNQIDIEEIEEVIKQLKSADPGDSYSMSKRIQVFQEDLERRKLWEKHKAQLAQPKPVPETPPSYSSITGAPPPINARGHVILGTNNGLAIGDGSTVDFHMSPSERKEKDKAQKNAFLKAMQKVSKKK
jgi:hypothetical protein